MTPKWRDLRAELASRGARPVRTRGSHEQWRLADGQVFTVVCKHLNDDVPVGILGKFKRLLREQVDPHQEAA